ncbi:GntR family transcriptional regulator [Kineosporia babensis]|uniref:GntR family transcriptional regulator n=1 Tax=Kineosporia babensis TaxID=499548 RepID=A0A9X1NBU8_9ACTN|nr:GntR family transcriptional regulator [Kineosporia babensis]MCD5312097.1 GntR family transcriptional regulator [Kineosporia babensis]
MPSPVPAAQRVYTTVRQEILEGELRGGSLLSEVEVAARLGVSRTPVHEAFLKLETEDFLQLLPRRGALVVLVHPDEAGEILEVRHALEVAAARRLSKAAAARDRFAEESAAHLHAQQDAVDREDLQAFAAGDELFHRSIVTTSGNRIATKMYGTLTDRQRRMTVGALGGRLDRLPVLVEEHTHLRDLVLAGDVDAFATSLLEHLSQTHTVTFGS